MATAEECHAALESLVGRITAMDAKAREAHLLDRSLSCRVTDLSMTFMTRLGPHGADDIRVAENGSPQAQVRFTADSDTVVAIAADPRTFMRAWGSGKLKVNGNVLDLWYLRKLL